MLPGRWQNNIQYKNKILHYMSRNFLLKHRYPHIHKQEVKYGVNKMLDQKMIQVSISPWLPRVWEFSKKMDASGKQKWRVDTDYRKLSEVTVNHK